MDNKYKNIAIKINNAAEKLAALYFLSGISGLPINDLVLNDTKKERYIMDYPYIIISDNEISAVIIHLIKSYKIVPFKDINKIDEYLKPTSVEVELDDLRTAVVTKDKIIIGCYEFPIDGLKKLQEAHEKLLTS